MKFYTTKAGRPMPVILDGRFVNKLPRDIAFYLHLNDPKVIRKLQIRFDGQAIVYGLRCQVDNMIYIGSSLNPGLRFHKHLISNTRSNAALQAAIQEHGLGMFTAQIFEQVDLSMYETYYDKKSYLLECEQRIMNMIPREQLYNSIDAVAY
jgi:hypothetical protein